MENRDYVREIKKVLLTSPIRERLGNSDNVPFKDLISNNLNEVMESIEILESKENKPLKIVIVGEVKAGKSSLINALLSVEVSEVDVLESTSSVIEVTYDKKRSVKKSKDITKIGLDLEYLKKINLVDTPGLKSITINNEQKTLSYIQNADLILFVMDATHIGQEDIEEALEVLASYRKPIVGIINKCDLLDDNYDNILDYIKYEYDLHIKEFFMISSYLEFQNKVSKNAKAGETDLIISSYTKLKDNFIKLTEYIDNVYKNAEYIKINSTNSSTSALIQKDIVNHYDYLKSVTMLLEELKKHEKLLDNKFDYISAKMEFEINDWINRSFLENEISKIKDDIENTNIYINENYVNELINKKKIEFDSMFFKEWSECLQEVNNEIDGNIKRYMENINYRNELINAPTFKLEYDKTNLNEMLITVGTGAVLGVTSGTVVSIYAAGVGTSAATVSMGTALMTYCPPLLIAGTVTGAVGKLLYDKIQNDKKNKDVLNDVDEFRESIKGDILNGLKEGYIKSSKDIVNTTIEIYKNSKGIFLNKYELENLLEELDKYIEKLNINLDK